MDAKGRHHAIGRIRAFRAEEITVLADARAAAFDSFGTANAALRALRAERRNKGSAGYDLIRHIGLVRRLRPHPPASGRPMAQG